MAKGHLWPLVGGRRSTWECPWGWIRGRQPHVQPFNICEKLRPCCFCTQGICPTVVTPLLGTSLDPINLWRWGLVHCAFRGLLNVYITFLKIYYKMQWLSTLQCKEKTETVQILFNIQKNTNQQFTTYIIFTFRFFIAISGPGTASHSRLIASL